MGSRRLVVLSLSVMLAACGDPPVVPEEDATAPEMDGGHRDDAGAPETCTVDEDCGDSTFCDGAERCMPGATDADGHGCVEATSGPCGEGETCDEATSTCNAVCADVDRDDHGDTACGGDDCDDDDPNRYPGNVEVCDMAGHDEDCNSDTFGFLDADSDGSGSYLCCNVLAGGDLRCGDDCNDGDSAVSPRAGDGPPLYCDGLDNDCSGTADEGCPCVEGETQECGTEPQRMRIGACRPGTQVCSGGAFTDSCIGAIAPGEELCDAIDNDCDGTTDEAVLRNYYPDVDGDGFGATGGIAAQACSAPVGYASNATDCDDAIASVNPGATEVCNARDDNCTGGVDEGFVATFYRDSDLDGFGDATMSMSSCSPPAGYVRNPDDCDDTRAGTNPAATEVCNGRDDDCAGGVDDGVLRTFYVDVDRDTFGAVGTTTTGCTAPTGYTDRAGDCNDSNAGVNPSSAETCNGRDDNCDASTDPGCACTDGTSVQCGPTVDTGECTFGSQTCVAGTLGGCVGAVLPATETCNGRDDDCDGSIDDGTTASGCYRDGDGDGHGTGGATTQCSDATRVAFGSCPVGWVNNATDCNDGVTAIRPGATEVCDGIDQDCDGTADDGVSASPCYVDGDGDGAGTGTPTTQCRDAARMAFGYCPAGFTATPGDCNDASSAVRPGATETCNGLDDDCSGVADNGFTCVRGATRTGTAAYGSCASVSGTFTCNATCTGELFTPILAPETCNAMDDNCNGVADETFACVRGTTGLGCSTACGTPGTQTCSASCARSTCVAAGESCNACDDDGDSQIDEGLDTDGIDACRFGQMRTCTTACGSSGSQRCRPDCAGWEACRASGEGPTVSGTCNACDDDLDGRVDEGFACEQNRTYSCAVAGCGTPGQLVCNASCAYVSPTCAAPFETCNYCDDDRDGTFYDESVVAGSSMTVQPTCCAASLYGGATCRMPNAALGDQPVTCPFGDDDFQILCGHVVNLTSGAVAASTTGYVWFTEPVRVGYGVMRFEVQMQAARTTALPGSTWWVMLAEGASPPTSQFFDGNFVRWDEYRGSPTSEVDQIVLQSRTTSTTGPILMAADAPATRRLDSTDVLDQLQLQPLVVELQIDDPGTAPDEGELRALVDGTVIVRTSLHRRPVPGQLLWVGLLAGHDATNRMRTRFSAYQRDDYGSGDCDGSVLSLQSRWASSRTCY